MTAQPYLYVPVPPVPPRPPVLTLIGSSIRPPDTLDEGQALFKLGSDEIDLLPGDLQTELRARQGANWVRGITYAPEMQAAAEVRDQADFTSVDAPALAQPAGVTAVGGSGGTLTLLSTQHYQVTAVNANGETTAAAAVAVTLTGAQNAAVVSWDAVADTAQYRIYGRSGTLGLLATVGPFSEEAATASWTDTGAASPGAVVPVANTTGGPGTYPAMPFVYYAPPLVLVTVTVSSFGWSAYDYKGRAMRWLELAKFAAIEREFEQGILAQAKGYPNNYLSQSGVVVDLTPGTVPDAAGALAILQKALAEGRGRAGHDPCSA